MKRFLITSPAWEGEAELCYNEAGLLIKINLENCTIPEHEKIVTSFKREVPTSVSDIQAAFAKTRSTVVEASVRIAFSTWWIRYGVKINKARCIPLFDKLSDTDTVLSYYGIRAYDNFLKKESWRKKADPETYLRNRYWENEYK